MSGEDFVAHLGLTGDPFFAFQTAVTQLKLRKAEPMMSRAVNEPLDDLLSSAVVRALSGDIGSNSAAASFPIEYIRRCTHGFSDSHVIGRGGFGTVFRAVDPVVGVRFAVKRLNADTLASAPQHRRAAEQVRRRRRDQRRAKRRAGVGLLDDGASETVMAGMVVVLQLRAASCCVGVVVVGADDDDSGGDDSDDADDNDVGADGAHDFDMIMRVMVPMMAMITMRTMATMVMMVMRMMMRMMMM